MCWMCAASLLFGGALSARLFLPCARNFPFVCAYDRSSVPKKKKKLKKKINDPLQNRKRKRKRLLLFGESLPPFFFHIFARL